MVTECLWRSANDDPVLAAAFLANRLESSKWRPQPLRGSHVVAAFAPHDADLLPLSLPHKNYERNDNNYCHCDDYRIHKAPTLRGMAHGETGVATYYSVKDARTQRLRESTKQVICAHNVVEYLLRGQCNTHLVLVKCLLMEFDQEVRRRLHGTARPAAPCDWPSIRCLGACCVQYNSPQLPAVCRGVVKMKFDSHGSALVVQLSVANDAL